MTQQKMAPANAKPAGPPSVTIDLGSPDPLIVHLGESSITLWPMKEHIYREYVQSVPQLAKLLPKDGEKSDGKDLLKKASADQFAAVGLIWSFIRCCIDSLDEYVSLRQRIYGEPKDPDALSGVEHLTMEDIDKLPPASEPLSLHHMGQVMRVAVEHFRPESAPDES